MFSIIYLIILTSIIQGIFEWIPISSSGIVTIVSTLLGLQFLRSFDWSLALHLGSGLAAFTLFWRDFTNIFRDLRDRRSSNLDFKTYITLILVSIVVGGSIYLIFSKTVHSEVPGRIALAIIGIFLIITGIVDYSYQRRRGLVEKLSSNLSLLDWIVLGLLQGIAVIPGLSRSGVVLAYLSFRKVRPDEAFKISLIIGAPILVIAGIGGIYLIRGVLSYVSIAYAVLISYFTSLVFGFLFYKAFMKLKVWHFAIIIGIMLIVSMFLSL